MNRVACIVVSYNMAERADALAEAIQTSRWPCDLILVDNGSDITAPSKYTTLRLPKNVQTTNGWLAGVRYANEMFPYFAYQFIITSAEPVTGDFVGECAERLLGTPGAVGAHPALTADSTTMWTHMQTQGKQDRQTWMIDNICSMYRADWFHRHPFDPALVYGHGIDLEICYHARKEAKTLWLCEGAQVRKVTDIGYQLPISANGKTVIENRMNMSADDRRKNAFRNMTDILGKRYGAAYWDFLTQSYRNEATG